MIRKIVIGIIILLIGTCIVLYRQNARLSKEFRTAMNNMKAYETELCVEKENTRVYELTAAQLSSSRDSIVQRLKSVQKELGIKDSKLQQLQHYAGNIHKTDTICFRDTIFKDPLFCKDTVIGDRWFEMELMLQYPGSIEYCVDIELENSVYIVKKRETIYPPKKFFLWRWFQRKHTVAEIMVKEENPYVRNKEYKIIQIIK